MKGLSSPVLSFQNVRIFKEIPPTAGFPFLAKDLFYLFKSGTTADSLREDFKKYLGLPYSAITYSGTAAFYIILVALKTLSAKKTVIIPAYICPLVPLAIKRAGLKIEVCDIQRDSFDFNPREIERIFSVNHDILAVIPAHLGGIPLNLQRLIELAGINQTFIIEDCAQSLGAISGGRHVGTLGDFAFFSLCRGKGLTIYEGGVIVTRHKEYGAIIDKKIKELVKNDDFSEGLKILELFGDWLFYRPALFWFVFQLPQIFWNLRGQGFRAAIEYFDEGFATHNVSSFRKFLGHLSFWRLEAQIDKQRDKALYYIEKLKDAKGVRVISEAKGARAIYPYLTLVFDEPGKRNEALRLLTNSGLGVSQIYCCAISDYGYLKDLLSSTSTLNARQIAERELTLSTSTFLKREDQDYIIRIIKELRP